MNSISKHDEQSASLGHFEDKLNRLESLVQKMEEGNVTLDESLRIFEEGVKLARECHQNLNTAEQKIQVLMGMSEEGEAEWGTWTDEEESSGRDK